MIEPRTKLALVTPSIRSAAVSYWFRGRSLPVGTYRVRYAGGVMDYASPTGNWGVGDAAVPSNGFYIRGGGPDLYGPQLNSVFYATPGAAQIANAAAPPVLYNHSGGPLGMFLQDSPYADNGPAPWGTPTFSLELVTRGGAWSPANLPGVFAWFRSDGPLWQNAARTVPATANGDPIGAWDDLSGNGNHITQTTLSARPTLTLASLNGQNAVDFNSAANNWLLRSGITGVPAAFPFFVYLVVRPATAGRLIAAGSTGGNGYHMRVPATNQVGAWATASFVDQVALQFPGFTVTGTWIRLAALYTNPVLRTIQTNNNTPTSGGGTSVVPTPTGIAVGSDWNGGSGFGWTTMSVVEAIYTAAVPSAADLTALNDYVVGRYGL